MKRPIHFRPNPPSIVLGVAILSLFFAGAVSAEPVKYQVTGLFAPERAQDLRDAFAKIPELKLVGIDYKNAEVTLEMVAAKEFASLKPVQVVQRLDGMLKSASNHTFGIKPLRMVPREQLVLIEIPAAGLDCKGCCLAAYEAVARVEGVEIATASFREGRVTALIDPRKTNREALEVALKQIGVELKPRQGSK